jgi:regulator of replication initiation timing
VDRNGRASDEWAELRQRLDTLAEENGRLREENAQLREENARLRADNAHLQEQVRELRARLGQNSRNSSRPPLGSAVGKEGAPQAQGAAAPGWPTLPPRSLAGAFGRQCGG